MRGGPASPYQFMLEYWKFYDTYMQRKEHLVEAAITAYSALAVLVLTRSIQTWQEHGFYLVVFAVVASVLVEQFIHAQFQYWQSGVKLNVAAQSVAADWLSSGHVAAEDLKPVTAPEAPDVRMPQALKAELAARPSFPLPHGFFRRWVTIACSGGAFARIAYRLMVLWWLAFAVRAALTRTQELWGLRDLWLLLRRAWS
jgi:hypothetical protein